MASDEFVAGPCGGLGGEWVNNNPTFSALDECDVRDVVTAYLPYSVGYFKQSVVGIETSMPPQAGVHGVWCLGGLANEVISIGVGHHSSRWIVDASAGI